MAHMGAHGSAHEKGVGAAYTALETLRFDYNEGFLREDASLHIIVISDEDDHTDDRIISQEEFTDYLLNLKEDTETVTFSSVVNEQDCCSGRKAEGEPGTAYMQLTEDIGGIQWPITSEDWSTVLMELGILAAGLKGEFFLSQLPVLGTITVQVTEDGETTEYFEGTDWNYDQSRNSITFVGYVPTPLATIEVDYELL